MDARASTRIMVHRLQSLPVLGIVIPCYNEQEVLGETCIRLDALLTKLVDEARIDRKSKVWFIDDGSGDDTWLHIQRAASPPDSRFCGLKLSRNQGHQVALLAGLMSAEGDALISLDADLQDDLEVIPRMVAEYKAGHDLVYAVRGDRQTDTFFKSASASVFYNLLKRLGVEIVPNHADFRLMSRRAIEALREYHESNLFLRGIVPQLGFPSTTVTYSRQKRFAGESKYPLHKMLALAWQGVTSFSAAPLRAITTIGVGVSGITLALGLWALWVRLFSDEAVPGWASIVIPLFFISAVQLLSLGILGEYLAKVFVETKRRPLYFIESFAPKSPNSINEVAESESWCEDG